MLNRHVRRALSAVVLLIATLSTAPAHAQKAALVRDADRPSVMPVHAQCTGTFSCVLYTVPANMVLVVDTVSYRTQSASAITISPAIGFGPAGDRFMIFKSAALPAGGLVSDVVTARSYHAEGTVVTMLIDFPSRTGFVFATLDGYLVPAGSP